MEMVQSSCNWNQAKSGHIVGSHGPVEEAYTSYVKDTVRLLRAEKDLSSN